MLENGPLTGCKVLELGSTIAGPFCARVLADFGAEVIKVEPPEGDTLRSLGHRHNGKSLYAATLLRNKSLVAIDLRGKRGREIVRSLASKCDIVVENFKPGTLEKWGLGYDDLRAANDGLIMVRISGFGQTGPYSSRAGYGIISEAVSGLRHLIGDPDRPPARVAVALTDYITGLYAALGAVMALHARRVTGVGQCIDAALNECAFSFLESHVPAYEKLGIVAKRAGSRLANSAPNNLYQTKDGQHVHITAIADPVFKRMSSVMGREDLPADARFATAVARGANIDALDSIVAQWTQSLEAPEIERRLTAAEVPATRIFTMADIFKDPHYLARGMLVEVPDDELGTVTLAAPVPVLSGTPGRIRRSGGKIGRDTARVLKDVLGMARDEIEALELAGIVSVSASAQATQRKR
ncbi:MAG: CoA transferase [Betaproteobacteria bacterium]|nr:CoA transferase [Betaproteobacteria bacterium]